MTKKYKLLMYPKPFPSKDASKKHSGEIRNHLLSCPAELTIEEIASGLMKGYSASFCYGEKLPGQKTPSQSEANWKQQQLIGVDFDNEDENGNQRQGEAYLTAEQAMKMCLDVGFTPALIYFTFTNKPEWQRYRIVFALDKPITDRNLCKQAIRGCLSIFTKGEGKDMIHYADEKCTDLARFFYGGTEVYYCNGNANAPAELLIKRGKNFKLAYAPVREQVKEYVESGSAKKGSERLEEVLKEVDLVAHGCRIKPEVPPTRTTAGFEGYTAVTPYKYYISSVRPNAKSPQPLDFQGFVNDQYRILRDVPLNQFLLGTDNTIIRCILPTHSDENPSAGFRYYEETGWRYHCFACNVDYDIFQLLRVLSGQSHFTVRKYLCQKFNLPYETPWQIEQQLRLIDLKDYINRKGVLEVDYPIIEKALMKSGMIGTYNLLLDVAMCLIIDSRITEIENEVLFFLPKQDLYRLAKRNGLEISDWTMTKNIKMLAHYGLIDIMADKDLPKPFLNRLNKWRIAHQFKFRPTVYHIPMLSPEKLEQIQKQIVKDKQSNIRRKKLGRAQCVMADPERADAIYVQQQGKELSAPVRDFYRRYRACAQHILEKKGYTCEQEICNRVRGPYSAKEKVNLSMICMPRLLDELDLRRIPYSKKIEEEFHVRSTQTYKYSYGASRIIVPKEKEGEIEE